MAELKGLEHPKISVWGAAYKADVDDARESPALRVLEALEELGARVSAVDQHVKEFKYQLDDLETSISGADCILLLTDHREFTAIEPESLGPKMRHRIVFDTRNCLARAGWEKAGFRVVTL